MPTIGNRSIRGVIVRSNSIQIGGELRFSNTMKKVLVIFGFLAATAVAAIPSDQGSAPDNTGRNATEQVTAENQGGSAIDRDLTRNIRRSLVKTGSLSSTAKNVKVITVDRKVTLRGPVDSKQEKMEVNSIAERIAGKGMVNNQLSVKKAE